MQGLGRVRGWMTPAPGWLWQVKCVGGIVWQTDAGLGGSARSRDDWPAAAATSKQASSGSREQRALLTLTTEPKRRSLKIWVGMQAELERACVVGRLETACSTNPLGCVGYRQSAWAGLLGGFEAGMERSLMSVHGYLTCVLVSAASDEPGRQAGLTRACVSWACVDGRTRGCARGVCTVCEIGCVQHMRGRHGRRALPTVTST